MPDSFQKKIQHEILQIDHLLDSFRPLLEIVKVREPDIIELSALATVLHSFYGGIENIFATIGKNLDDQVPNGAKWHKDLLIQMSKPTENRSAIVGSRLHTELTGFLSFRHFFRNSYAYQLDWDQLHPLIRSISETWSELKESLVQLLDVGKEDPEDPV